MNLEELQEHEIRHEFKEQAPSSPPSSPPSSLPYAPDVSFQDDERFKFICGTAGTGKTFAVRELAKSDRRVKLVATTGIAAVNLGGESTTINAAIGYFDTASLDTLYQCGRLEQILIRWARQGVTHWVLDEASMLDGRQLTHLVRGVNEANAHIDELKDFQDDTGEPLTTRPRIRLTLVGDFAQLPPVDAPFAFERDEWEVFEPNTTMLTTIRRQTDQDFIRALQLARRGDATGALEYFRGFIHPNKDLEFPGTTIVSKNAEVDRHNGVRLSDLRGERSSYSTMRWGTQRPEWSKNIPDSLMLKEGATVMILANKRIPDSHYFEYVNGDIGKVTDLSVRTTARLGDEMEEVFGAEIEIFRTGETVVVTPVRRQVEELVETRSAVDGKPGSGNFKKQITGEITYLPVRVAYATTVHKSQGLTLDHVQVCFNDHFFARGPGMLYVALSRVRSPQGLRLVGNVDVFVKRCVVDEKVRRWL